MTDDPNQQDHQGQQTNGQEAPTTPGELTPTAGSTSSQPSAGQVPDTTAVTGASAASSSSNVAPSPTSDDAQEGGAAASGESGVVSVDTVEPTISAPPIGDAIVEGGASVMASAKPDAPQNAVQTSVPPAVPSATGAAPCASDLVSSSPALLAIDPALGGVPPATVGNQAAGPSAAVAPAVASGAAPADGTAAWANAASAAGAPVSGSDREAQLEQVIQVLRVQLDTAIAQVQALIAARDTQISPVLASPVVSAPATESVLAAPDAHLTLLNGWYQEMRVLGRGLSGEVHRLLGATETYLGLPR